MPLTAEQVWNRAAIERAGTTPRRGDQLLHAVLVAHGLVMNGGVMHALEVLTREETDLARLGYVRLGLPQVADLLVYDVGAAEAAEMTANRAYAEAVPDDGALLQRFRADFETNREDYADD